VEADEVYLFAATVFGYFQQVEDAEESGFAREFGCDVRETDGLDGIDLDFAFFHAVASAFFDARSLPDSDAAGDVSATNAIAEPLCKHHGRESTRAREKNRNASLCSALGGCPKRAGVLGTGVT
jgi:hypothetical protein